MNLRPPGVYEERSESGYTPLALRELGVVGFVGLAQRGPLNAPVKVRDYGRFTEVFGKLSEQTYLDATVRAFFENGGRECYVLRVAHMDARKPGELATTASSSLIDSEGEQTLFVDALNEGDWGNSLAVEVFSSLRLPRTFITLDVKAGDEQVTVKSTHGIERGTMLRFFDDDGNEEILTAIGVEGHSVRLAPGSEPKRKHLSSAPTYVEPVSFGLKVSYLGREEVYNDLSASEMSPYYFETVVNGRSGLIRVKDARSPSEPPKNLPVAGQSIVLSGGTDGFHSVCPDDFVGMSSGPTLRYGLASFEGVDDVDLLCCPDLMWAHQNSSGFHSLKDVEVVQRAFVSMCELLRDRFVLLDIPEAGTPSGALEWRQLFDSPYAAFYFPWVTLRSGDENLMLPASGVVAGVYARCDINYGLHKPPANEEIFGVSDVAVELTDTDLGTLNNRGINCLRPLPAKGIRVWGARTASSDPLQRHIPVRRITSAIIRAMQRDLQWAVFEPNSRALWKKVVRNIAFFLYDLWKRGYFKGSSPEEAFFVKCDDENNPEDVRDEGMLVVDVGVAPIRPAEFLLFRISQEVEAGGGEEL